jgi:topoisomerase-4 subunit A
LVTKELISKITQKEVGGSTLAARKIWYDEIVGRLNDEKRGKFLGDFRGEDKILTLYSSGEYRLSSFDLATHFDDDLIHIEKWHPDRPISAVYYDGEKDMHFVKRFVCEVTSDKKVSFISESEGSRLDVVSTAYQPTAVIVFNKLLKATKNLPDKEVRLDEFIDIKGMKSQGNQLTKLKVKEILLAHAIEGDTPWPDEDDHVSPNETASGTEQDEAFEDEEQTADSSSTESNEVPSEETGEAPREVEWDLTQLRKPKKGNDTDDEGPIQPTLF